MADRLLSVGPESDLLLTRNAVLREAGFSIYSRRDPDEALTLLREENFAAVLLCHLFPTKTKQWLIRRVKEEKPHTPVVVMSNGHRTSGGDAELPSGISEEAMVRAITETITAWRGRNPRTP